MGDEAALVKLNVKIESRSDHINLKEALVRLGSARHSERIKAGTQPYIEEKKINNNNNKNIYL